MQRVLVNQKCSACKPHPQTSCTFGKYCPPPSRDFWGGRIMSLNLDPGPCSGNPLSVGKVPAVETQLQFNHGIIQIHSAQQQSQFSSPAGRVSVCQSSNSKVKKAEPPLHTAAMDLFGLSPSHKHISSTSTRPASPEGLF